MTVFLPRRLAHRVSPGDSRETATGVAGGDDNWGLAKRIGALPGVTTTNTVLDDGTTATDHFIEAAYVLRSLYSSPTLLCHIDPDGILLPQLDPTDKPEIALKGWACRADDETVLHLPRDSIEMEIAWRVILRAYQYLASRPPHSRARRKTSPELPQCVSTAKYWM